MGDRSIHRGSLVTSHRLICDDVSSRTLLTAPVSTLPVRSSNATAASTQMTHTTTPTKAPKSSARCTNDDITCRAPLRAWVFLHVPSQEQKVLEVVVKTPTPQNSYSPSPMALRARRPGRQYPPQLAPSKSTEPRNPNRRGSSAPKGSPTPRKGALLL